MDDRLVWLLNCFELRARVFQAGPLCHSAEFDAEDGLGYIHMVHSGLLRLETAGQAPRTVAEPSLLFYMNPTDHRLLPQEMGTETVCGSFEFGAGLSNPLVQALPEVQVITLRDIPALEMAATLLFKEAAERHCGRQAVLDRLIEVVIIQLLRALMDQNRLEFGLLAGLAHPKLMKAINAMHAEPSRAWSLEALAEVAGMSRARFAACFRDTVGVPPGTYLTDWRMAVAQSMLRRGKPVQIIADEVGYASASALSRAFSAQLGLSPTDWLKQHAATG